eukprot:2979430-Pleurochrysis_carterae.AAC.2
MVSTHFRAPHVCAQRHTCAAVYNAQHTHAGRRQQPVSRQLRQPRARPFRASRRLSAALINEPSHRAADFAQRIRF